MRIMVLEASRHDRRLLENIVRQTFPDAAIADGTGQADLAAVHAAGSGAPADDGASPAQYDIHAAALFPLENPNPVLRIDRDGWVLFANRAAERLLRALGAAVDVRLPVRWQQEVQATLEERQQRQIRLSVVDRVFELDALPIVHAGYVNVYARDVTAQVRADEALRQERDRLQAIMEHSSAALAYLDCEFNLVAFNAAYEVACRRSRAEMIGRNLFDFFLDARVEAIFRRVRATGEQAGFSASPFEFSGQSWRGVTYWDWTLSPVVDGAAGVRGLILSAIDVTDRVRDGQFRDTLNAVYALVNSTRDFDTLMQAVLDEAARVLRCQSATLLLARDGGWLVEAAHGLTAHLSGRQYTPAQVPLAALVAETRQPQLLEEVTGEGRLPGELWTYLDVQSCLAVPLLHHDEHFGTIVFGYHHQAVRFGNAEAEFAHRLATLISLAYENTRLDELERETVEALRRSRDELERRVQERTAELSRREAVLAEVNAQLRYQASLEKQAQEHMAYQANLLENVNDAIVAYDPDLRITAWNHAAEIQYGWKAEEVMGAYAPDVIGSQLSDEERAAALDTIARTGHWQGEVRHTRRDGMPIVVEATSMALRDDAGRIFANVTVNRDITERKRVEEELRAGREQLQSLSRRLVEMQENERYDVANQLYNDEGQRLAALILGLGQAQKDEGCDPRMSLLIAEMIDLANGVLSDMHNLAVNLRPASLDRLGLEAALRQHIMKFGQDAGVEVQVELGVLVGARLPLNVETSIFRIVQDALANTARHGHAGCVSVTAVRRDDLISVIVEDDGVGFDVEEVERRGGLGLFGMRERARAIGGSLTIESGPGKGTTVYIEVPFHTH